MKNIFNSILVNKPKRNFFDLSHDRKFSMEMGTLTPCHVQEVIPGDKVTLKSTQLIRFAPMVSPAMHRIDVYTHYFFVPNRLLWNNWEEFITGGDGTDPAPVFPYVDLGEVTTGTNADYLGLPSGVYDPKLRVSPMPMAAFNKIYNDYYRDQNLQPDEKMCNLVDGVQLDGRIYDDLASKPYERAWEHDYFTAALPFAQKGAAVTIPLGTEADIVFDPQWNGEGDPVHIATSGANLPSVDLTTNASAQLFGGGVEANLDNSKNLKADLSTATAATVNDLRRAYKLQEWLEKNARGGSRYIETILSHFGVRSSDARLQRPEYLGGGKSPVSISEVLQTSESITTPQGNLAGHGINVGQSHSFTRSFEEHGYIIGIISVMPKPAYQQGVHRHFTKFDKLDYFWPSFAHIGEQEIKNKELYIADTIEEREATFGYIPRYAEYRYLPSTVHGDFRETLSYWHMSRIFDTPPALNSDFISCRPTDRIFAVQDLPDDDTGENPVRNYDKLYCHVYLDIQAVRPLPKYGIPSM